LAEIRLLCDVDPGRSAALAAEFGLASATYEEICADPQVDAVTICTPSGTHGDLARRALEAGKHVIVEKPMDVSVEACERLLEAARESDRRLAVVSQHRFDPASQRVGRLARDGRLGELFFVEARIPWYRSQDYYDSGKWRGTLAMDGGGCLMNQGIHTVDLMLWLAGPVKRVRAVMATAAHERIEVEDLITVQIDFASGARGLLLGSTALYPGFPASLGLYGTSGSALIEGDRLKTVAIRGEQAEDGEGATAHALQVASGGTRSATAGVDEGEGEEGEWKWGDAHRAQLADFAESVRSNQEPAVTGRDGLEAVRFIKACYESAERDSWLRL